MGLEERLQRALTTILIDLAEAGELDRGALGTRYSIEPPRKGGSGDLACNVALALAKAAGKPPRQLAEVVAARLRQLPEISAVDIAGPGFINVSFQPIAFHDILAGVLEEGSAYGRARAAVGERVNVEFVSANPTGPLLISHGRGAVVGDVVARLLEVTGHRVTREYYINDFGNQVRLLADSVLALHEGREPPEGGYGGDYVRDLATFLAQHRPELLTEAAREERKRQCITLMLDGIPGSDLLGIRQVLANLGIEFDVWSSEEALHRWAKVDRTLDRLNSAGRLLHGDDGAVLFVTGDEDDKDRVVKKRDGAYTYFASDIAYHDDKLSRGFTRMINVWGADHHGYVARLRSAIEAVGHDPGGFEVLLFQLVSLLREGKPYRMGKRLGNLITLQEVMEEIDEAVGNPHAGRDAVRFFFLSRRVDTPITMDVELAKKQEAENPVFYIQYGHARLCSIQLRAKAAFQLDTPRFSPELAREVSHPLELRLLALLGRYPSVVREAAAGRDPHKVVFYLQEIAQSFQSYYTQLKQDGDAILPMARDRTDGWEARWNRNKTLGRLLWIDAIRSVYRNGLDLLGLEAPERMTREDEEEPTATGA